MLCKVKLRDGWWLVNKFTIDWWKRKKSANTVLFYLGPQWLTVSSSEVWEQFNWWRKVWWLFGTHQDTQLSVVSWWRLSFITHERQELKKKVLWTDHLGALLLRFKISANKHLHSHVTIHQPSCCNTLMTLVMTVSPSGPQSISKTRWSLVETCTLRFTWASMLPLAAVYTLKVICSTYSTCWINTETVYLQRMSTRADSRKHRIKWRKY